MNTPSGPYGTRTNNAAKKPVYFVNFGPVGDGSINPALPYQFSTGPVLQPTVQRKTWMDTPTGATQNISVLGGTSSVGNVQIPIQDKDNTITMMVSKYQHTWKNRDTTLYAGYDDLPESQFIPIFRGVVNDVQTSRDAVGWIFSVADFQRLAKKAGFGASTILVNQISETANSMQVFDFSQFATQTVQGDLGPVNFLRIDDEIISYNLPTQTPDSIYTTVTILERGLFGTAAKTHDVNTEVKNCILLDGNPLDILLRLYLSTGNGTNGEYDVLPAGQGAGIPQEYVDVKGIENQRDRLMLGYRMQLFVEESTEIKSLIESEIFKVVNAYPVIKSDGRLSMKMYTVPYPVDVVADFTDTNIVDTPSFTLNMASQGSFYNIVKFQYDYDPIQDKYLTQDIYVNEQSLANTNEQAILTVTSKGLRSGKIMGGADLVRRYAKQIFQRFSYGCPTIRLNTNYSQHLVEVGDFVTVKSAWLPDLSSGRRNGTPVICEVVDKAYDFRNGKIAFTLQATGFLSTKRWCIIGPSGQPTYGTATDKQREYGFVSNQLSLVVGVMSNGDDGYYISP